MILRLILGLTVLCIFFLLIWPIFNPIYSARPFTEARLQLKHLYELQHVHHRMHNAYVKDFETIGFEAPKTFDEGGESRYNYEIVEANESNFKARATAVVDFDGDGKINTFEITEEGNLIEVIPD